ncbi:helix-turn-helix domain-containing protein [Streptomyces sp. V1I1]|uniref:helix-turn-helix domain-containing protein n=1 Tax=Streptomyces sp. V1I1 TaxID=3042272 RepID=UPI0027807BAD|nr:helix-turn-helix domain-containing protein [Streptomyces sp. V1I1]MDQ0939752.1 sugar diacid utilization regulator [Streptomyces sp. V1I1]
MPQLVAAAVRQERSRYTESVLGSLHERGGWPALRETLIAWAEGGFSLLRAERLGVHRNTLLYRLDKIDQLSGQRGARAGGGDRALSGVSGDLLDTRPE